ncbi:hypothetical protein [Cyclobacterium marinum]|uniref:Uncharacterized protein n=1 Tax=Cyclobacterium marinum (strain ATCC 25205 / DSM 745 / LMG 13164 / NCIMB 1802) TaxID=880070 RepID=G0IZN6_CYCMS|nr:hypothetical protein [Cyclobacterium marinum]AEL25700.1 hypothetical protein Cycma_1952 [Cyclobacterium marinum DSM 745]
MKLNKEIKNQIDQYFENIESKELYDIAVGKYGFVEIIDFEIDSQTFEKVSQSYYCPNSDNALDTNEMDSLLLAA